MKTFLLLLTFTIFSFIGIKETKADGFEIGQLISPKMLCLSEEAITNIAVADAESLLKSALVTNEYKAQDECRDLVSGFVVAVITEVIIDYIDYEGKASQAVKVEIVNFNTDTSIDIYTVVYSELSKEAPYHQDYGPPI